MMKHNQQKRNRRMTTRWGQLAALAMVAALIAGCGHSQTAERDSGDEAMEAGNYAEAVERYRFAKERNPGSSRLQRRVDEAEEALFEQTMSRMNAAEADNDPQRVVAEAANGVRFIEDVGRLRTLEENSEAVVFDSVDELRSNGEYETALAILRVHRRTFETFGGEIDRQEEQIRGEWKEVLSAQAQAHMRDGRYGAAALKFAKSDDVAGVDPAGEQAMDALRKVQNEEGWGIYGKGNIGGERVERILDEVFADPTPDELVDTRMKRPYTLPVELRIDEIDRRLTRDVEIEERTVHFHTGSETVGNPLYERRVRSAERLDDEIDRLEQSVEEAQSRLEQAEFDLRQQRERGASTAAAQREVARATRQLRQRQRVLNHRNYQRDRVQRSINRTPPTLQRPETSEYTYEVERQKAEMTIILEVSLVVQSRDFSPSERLEVTTEAETLRHDAQPEIELEADERPPPSEEALEEEADHAVPGAIRDFVFGTYNEHYGQVVGDVSLLSKDDEIDALARVAALHPENRTPKYEDRLRELVKFEDGGGLLVRLARDLEREDH